MPLLRPFQNDWRIWKTCGVFEGQITHTLVSNPAQPTHVDYFFAQASSDRVYRVLTLSLTLSLPL